MKFCMADFGVKIDLFRRVDRLVWGAFEKRQIKTPKENRLEALEEVAFNASSLESV